MGAGPGPTLAGRAPRAGRGAQAPAFITPSLLPLSSGEARGSPWGEAVSSALLSRDLGGKSVGDSRSWLPVLPQPLLSCVARATVLKSLRSFGLFTCQGPIRICLWGHDRVPQTGT